MDSKIYGKNKFLGAVAAALLTVAPIAPPISKKDEEEK